MPLTLKLALRTLARRKGRMALIGSLVAFGTFLIVFGTIFASSTRVASKAAIIEKFTGDFIVYSDKSKELPSPFAFQTPLPKIRDIERVEAALAAIPEVKAYAPYAQNYGIVQIEREGRKVDLPIIYYAIEPVSYAAVFGEIKPKEGSYFGAGSSAGGPGGAPASGGVMISAFQNAEYKKNFEVEVRAGESATVLGVTEGGVNSVPSRIAGVFEPERYSSVFNYINFLDAATYASVYNYSGVAALPKSLDASLAAAEGSEDAIFALAGDPGAGPIDVSKLQAERLSGATMIAVRLKDSAAAPRVIAALGSDASLGIKVADWAQASGFYAQISAGLQAFIFLATALVFLVVAMIFMNTLIINVTERTAEIGTMRAIGAERSFVRAVFLAEALALNLGAALVGLAASGAAALAFSRSGVALPDLVAQFLVGGGPVPIRASAWPFLMGVLVVAAVSVLATLYPVSVATKITPLKAMSDK
jgi:putative ABC transport system permease protein